LVLNSTFALTRDRKKRKEA